MYKGGGYCVGPGYDVGGIMVLEIQDKGKEFYFIVREDKPFTLEDESKRRCFRQGRTIGCT